MISLISSSKPWPHPQVCVQLPREPQPPCLLNHVRGYHKLEVPWAAERRPEKASCQHGSLPQASLLYARLRSPHSTRQPAVQGSLCSRIDSADVRCQEYDGCL